MQNIASQTITIYETARLPSYLTIHDCARILKVSYLHMWRLIKSQQGPSYVRVGKGVIRIPDAEFSKWINANQKADPCTPSPPSSE